MDFFSAISDTFDFAIDTYLSTNMTTAGEILHIGAIISSGLATGNAKKGRSLVDAIMIGSIADISRTVANFMNDMWDCLRDPNIEGIPIASPSIKVTRDSDVSQYPVLYGAGWQKANLVDSSAPHPREWSIDGYITSQATFDAGLVIKPSLMIQSTLLDTYMRTRRPLWFKDADMGFHKVLISHLEIEDRAEATNVKHVVMTLIEWVIIDLDAGASLLKMVT